MTLIFKNASQTRDMFKFANVRNRNNVAILSQGVYKHFVLIQMRTKCGNILNNLSECYSSSKDTLKNMQAFFLVWVRMNRKIHYFFCKTNCDAI